MAQWVKALTCKSGNLNSIPGTTYDGKRRELTPQSCLLVSVVHPHIRIIDMHTTNK